MNASRWQLLRQTDARQHQPSCLAPRASRDDHQRAVRQGPLQRKASCTGAVSQVSYSPALVSSTGIALGWIGATTRFGSVVRKADRLLGSWTLTGEW